MTEALRRCPSAVVISHGWDRYSAASSAFFEILGDFSPLVQSLSVDEAFVDISGCERLFGSPHEIATAIKRRVHDEIGLVVSVGVAPTKFCAKIASDLRKPDGLCIVETDELIAFLHALPVARLWGVGKVTQEKLATLGLQTIGSVAKFPEPTLQRMLGVAMGSHLAALARGEDSREVTTGQRAVTIGHEETFETDVSSRDEIRPRLLRQADRVGARLRRADLRARVVVVKIKYADFTLISRRRTLADPSSDGGVIAKVACELLDGIDIHGNAGKKRRVRLCGVATAGLESRSAPRQLTLTEPDREKGERLGDTLDKIQEKFGDTAIGRAIHNGKQNGKQNGKPKAKG